jgi:hypothetical protein
MLNNLQHKQTKIIRRYWVLNRKHKILIYLQNFLKMVTNCRRKTISWGNWIHVMFWKGLRFQLIEGRAMAQSDIKITLRTWKRSLQKTSEHKWHNTDKQPTDEEVQGIVARVLSNQDEVKKLSDQVAEKLLELFKEKANQQLKKLLMTNLLLCSYGE